MECIFTINWFGAINVNYELSGILSHNSSKPACYLFWNHFYGCITILRYCVETSFPQYITGQFFTIYNWPVRKQSVRDCYVVIECLTCRQIKVALATNWESFIVFQTKQYACRYRWILHEQQNKHSKPKVVN